MERSPLYCEAMKKPTHMIFLAGILFAWSANASQTYKCVANDGSVTFSFVSCPERVVTVAVSRMTVQQRLANIRDLDDAIGRERERFREVKADLDAKISASANRSQVQFLRDKMELETTALMERLTELRKDRNKLVNDDVRVLQSADQS